MIISVINGFVLLNSLSSIMKIIKYKILKASAKLISLVLKHMQRVAKHRAIEYFIIMQDN